MYESFYGLKEKPFTLLPDPEYLYLSPKHQRALTLLEYGMMNQAGFSVICGDTGAGKTTLIRRLLSELEDNTTVGLITNTHESFGELLSWVLMAFGLDGEGKSKAQMHQMFIAFLIEQYAQNKHSVLIVDEAQNMKADTLEELRMLSNINSDKDQVLQVILAGQPALRETLRKPELMQFAQRIAVDYYLEALSEEETKAYIRHRLHVAGSDKEIFTDDACKAIYKYSGGTPRLINLLSDTSLVYGFAEQSELIEAQLVHDVVREQHSNSIIPTFNTNQPHATDNLPPPQAEVAKAVESPPPVVETPAAKPEMPTEPAPDTSSEKKLPQSEDRIMAGLAKRAVDAVNSADKNGVSSKATIEVDTAKKADKSVDAAAQSDEVEEQNSLDNESLKQEESTDEDHLDDVAPYMTGRHQQDDDMYHPIVHIEEPPKKGMSGLLIGIVSGMFVASIMMMVFAWVIISDKEQAVPQAANTTVEQTSQKEADRLILESLQKERDAALAASRALEHERDAALVAAKAQEQMRAAELRAAEILAQQERKAEERLREARARMRQAESAEAKARERERTLQLKAQQLATRQEAQRLEALKIERQKLEVKKQAQAELMKAKRLSVVAKPKEVPAIVAEEVIERPEPKESKTFSSNPCNSPSAKFLSTCKR
jgi:general secretion pathway protein A